MRNTGYFKNKKVAVVGLGRSGLACANLLYGLGAKISVTDNNDNASTRLNAAGLESSHINVELGRHSKDFIADKDFVVVSPGVPAEALPIIWAQEFKIPMISEIEAAAILCPATIIAVTGTNGKTTVTTLIGRALEANGEKVFVRGNIGRPFSADLDKIREDDFVSLEVSSFQLERTQAFKPKIALILNFSPNHLDRHGDVQAYLAAKKRIFINQDKSDYLVLNSFDPLVRELGKESRAEVVYFSQEEKLNPNQSAVLAVTSILGINKEVTTKVFREFKGIEHRLEYVTEINNIKFINDSKSTTVDSTVWALKNISASIILIAGGRDKGNDYSAISELMRKKVKEVVLIGKSKDKLKDAFGGFLPISEATSLKEAVNLAFHKAASGDCVLLSPMCASFDMFSNYEDRGKCFKKAIDDLADNMKNVISGRTKGTP